MAAQLLRTSIGDFSLHEYSLQQAGRSWSFLHTGAVLTRRQEQQFLARERDRLPYGVMLWPAAIALTHDLLASADTLPGKRVLELGAGVGMPGIVAASLGARVLQVDRSEVAPRHRQRIRRAHMQLTSAENTGETAAKY